ncbi:MAG: 3-oxoacyl-(acyl-carrier-protein) synthase 3 [Bacteroidetes bacterium ADurb.BinA395]|nr:MAG: 3-oxoacyl-(acyl-carrier-protein) synthase 3 [Bacteroidetes bacterium ADurb.BinA395]
MKQLVRNVKIIGTGSYVPETIYTNKYLETIIPTSDKWIYENLGIKERRIASPNEATSDLASKAAINAIENSGLRKDDIDLIIVATATPDRLAPSTAAIVQDKIQAYHAVAFDISAVCSGFLYGMSVASQFIAAGVYDNVLVIGADTFSRIIDWTRRDAVFFGDGAGAAVISHGNINEGFLAFRLYTDGRGKYNFTVPAGGSEIPASEETVKNRLHYFQMNGKAVYETGTEVLPQAIRQVLSDTGLSIKDIDYMIPHQPSIRILQKTAEIIGLPWEKVMTNMDKYANTSGGTIPILLDETNRSGKLKKGNLILFAAVGSGWTYGASILKWS